jgi:hypothetical protein
VPASALFYVLIVAILLAAVIGLLSRSGSRGRRSSDELSPAQADRTMAMERPQSVEATIATGAVGGYAGAAATRVASPRVEEAPEPPLGAHKPLEPVADDELHPPLIDQVRGFASAPWAATSPAPRDVSTNTSDMSAPMPQVQAGATAAPTILAKGDDADPTEAAELAEEARERGDDGYVETFGNERDVEGPSSEYGPNSVLADGHGPAPDGWTIKGNADSMLFYLPNTPGYARSRADVWFRDEKAAVQAGFVRWDAHQR